MDLVIFEDGLNQLVLASFIEFSLALVPFEALVLKAFTASFTGLGNMESAYFDYKGSISFVEA